MSPDKDQFLERIVGVPKEKSHRAWEVTHEHPSKQVPEAEYKKKERVRSEKNEIDEKKDPLSSYQNDFLSEVSAKSTCSLYEFLTKNSELRPRSQFWLWLLYICLPPTGIVNYKISFHLACVFWCLQRSSVSPVSQAQIPRSCCTIWEITVTCPTSLHASATHKPPALPLSWTFQSLIQQVKC